MTSPPNRLIHESSPYLLQHAHNPVDWYPWGEEAFRRAREEDRPVFLSIGYATCHWCHAMAGESFEDPAVAGLLNAGFVCVKVDREERPDIDQVYLRVCQMLTGRGGWPLTILMTPDKRPFFAATYLPRESRLGMTGLLDLLPRIREMWTTRREELVRAGEEITDLLRRGAPSGTGAEPPSLGHLERGYRALEVLFDARYGGFGGAPRFPTPHQLLFLLRYHHRFPGSAALGMVEKTLRAVRGGGVYDQLGFGVHRYAVDEAWKIPHFEKMLYDQALLALACLECYQATGREEHARTAREIFTYTLRDLQAEEGGFYSAEDADSEGIEGRYYLWTREEIRAPLDPADWDILCALMEIRPQGNLPRPGPGQEGMSVLFRRQSLEAAAREEGMDSDTYRERWDRVRQILLDRRNQRARPLRDTKVLTDGNGLIIAALARAGRVLSEGSFTAAAVRAASRVLGTAGEGEITLPHVVGTREGEGFLDDYAFLTWGLLELYETTLDPVYLAQARRCMARLDRDFADEVRGGYFFTSSGSSDLPARIREGYDGAVPSGNSVSFLVLQQLAELTGDPKWEERAHQLWSSVGEEVATSPTGYCFLLLGVDWAVGPVSGVVVAGERDATETLQMIQELSALYLPRVLWIRLGSDIREILMEIAPFTGTIPVPDRGAVAYVCRDRQCSPPARTVRSLLDRLGEGPSSYPEESES